MVGLIFTPLALFSNSYDYVLLTSSQVVAEIWRYGDNKVQQGKNREHSGVQMDCQPASTLARLSKSLHIRWETQNVAYPNWTNRQKYTAVEQKELKHVKAAV